ncbi:hypothetical protein LOTGIDRAFT_165087 [Lottia gigantea]|uniref:Uncharacterized protein n=1 Tax=Lottia gigantea TaxID=225164 RepID=V3ZED0_LOTGI|nr:hypothetical protein LOTGIDRAFT_165087 [Lottia gigantea]ESO89493.1 hypothetical protein LOTGIDRAFT_165087 [Lottia gigantea]
MTYENDIHLHQVFKRILKSVTMNERIKRPSFMIKDILGNSETTCGSGSHRIERLTTKPSLPTLPIPSSVHLPYFSYPSTPIPHGLVGMRHPGHVPFMLPRALIIKKNKNDDLRNDNLEYKNDNLEYKNDNLEYKNDNLEYKNDDLRNDNLRNDNLEYKNDNLRNDNLEYKNDNLRNDNLEYKNDNLEKK